MISKVSCNLDDSVILLSQKTVGKALKIFKRQFCSQEVLTEEGSNTFNMFGMPKFQISALKRNVLCYPASIIHSFSIGDLLIQQHQRDFKT